jgi:hypothetical protein
MRAVPIKAQYGPTLGRILSPRWRAASRLTQGAVIASAVGLLALIVAAGLTLENAKYSQGGTVPFRFSYRNLYRVRPDPGGYVKVQRRSADGRLKDSFAVGPLRLPPYRGSLSGELPLYAAAYISAIKQRYPGFVLRGEGKARVNTVLAYDVFYTTVLEGRRMFGRDVLLLPERPGVREGVDIVILTTPTANPQVTKPVEVATAGVLARPLKTFTFG